jgi:hypothetical protein
VRKEEVEFFWPRERMGERGGERERERERRIFAFYVLLFPSPHALKRQHELALFPPPVITITIITPP